VARILRTALAQEPAQRFPSATEMERVMTTTDHAARASGSTATAPASTTDMSPELPKGISAHGTPLLPQVQVVAPQPASPGPSARPPSDSTLKAGEMPMLAGPGVRVALWVVIAVAILCLGLGFGAGLIAGRL